VAIVLREYYVKCTLRIGTYARTYIGRARGMPQVYSSAIDRPVESCMGGCICLYVLWSSSL